MPARAQRARRRAARIEAEVRTLRDRVVAATTHEARTAAQDALVTYLQLIADSDCPLWPIAKRVFSPSHANADDDIQALVAQLVDRSLSAPTSGSVHRRHAMGS